MDGRENTENHLKQQVLSFDKILTYHEGMSMSI